MTGWQLFISSWEWPPSVIVGCLALAGGYAAVVRRIDRYGATFVAGVLVMFIALVSPLDELGDDYLFSAHMLQHILLEMIAPPLFVLGLSPALVDRMMGIRFVAASERILGNPVVAWFAGIGTLWVWHVPNLYNLTLESETIHIIEHLMFLVTGTMFWWPVLAPPARRRLSPLPGIAYVGLGGLANTVLSVMITFAGSVLYTGYLHPEDELGALSLIRNTWGLDPLADQSVGGAIMWFFGGFIFLVFIMYLFWVWFETSDRETERANATPAT